jgi:hypothetical protein
MALVAGAGKDWALKARLLPGMGFPARPVAGADIMLTTRKRETVFFIVRLLTRRVISAGSKTPDGTIHVSGEGVIKVLK